MTATTKEQKRVLRSALLLAAAFCVLLFVLHGAQPLAGKGPKLDPHSFPATKKARYRVIIRGPTDQAVPMSLRAPSGEALSNTVAVSGKSWAILRARAGAPDASVVIENEIGAPQIGLQQIDERAPVRKWSAIGAFLFVAAWCLALNWRDQWAIALGLGIAYFVFLIPWGLPGFYAFTSDCRFYIPTSMSLLHAHDFDLDEFGGADPAATFAGDYRVRHGPNGHFYNLYPSGVAVLCLPITFVGEWLFDQIPDQIERTERISALAAKTLSAGTVALLFLALSQLTKRRGLAVSLALIFAFATPQLGTHGGGLWSNNASAFCAAIAIFLWTWRDGRLAFLSALPLAFGFACRPTMVIPGVAFALALLLRNPKRFAIFAALSGVSAILFIYHSLDLWGAILPPYYAGHARGENVGLIAYLGTLFSPNRGLFVFCPVLLFAIAGGAMAIRRPGPGKIYLLATFVCIAGWIVASRNLLWWGGHCYGPRVLSEAVPFAILLLIPAWERMEKLRARNIFLLLGLLACAWGLFVQVQALANPAVYDWNAAPDIDRHPERLWSWHDWEIFAQR